MLVVKNTFSNKFPSKQLYYTNSQVSTGPSAKHPPLCCLLSHQQSHLFKQQHTSLYFPFFPPPSRCFLSKFPQPLMSKFLLSHAYLLTLPHKNHSFSLNHGVLPIRSVLSAPEKRGKKKRQSRQQQFHPKDDDSTALEKALRFTFMEELMDRARNRDPLGVSDVIYDMLAAGLNPGPRSFHGLVVSHALNGDTEGAVRTQKLSLSLSLCAFVCKFVFGYCSWFWCVYR